MCEGPELRLYAGFGKNKGEHLSAMRKTRDEIAEKVPPAILKLLDDQIAIAVVEEVYNKHLPEDPEQQDLLAPKRKKAAAAKAKAESQPTPKKITSL